MKNSVLVVVLVLESGEIAASAVFKMYSYLRVPGIALQPWVRDLGGKETVLVGWWRGLLKEPWIGSSAEGKLVWRFWRSKGKAQNTGQEMKVLLNFSLHIPQPVWQARKMLWAWTEPPTATVQFFQRTEMVETSRDSQKQPETPRVTPSSTITF